MSGLYLHIWVWNDILTPPSVKLRTCCEGNEQVRNTTGITCSAPPMAMATDQQLATAWNNGAVGLHGNIDTLLLFIAPFWCGHPEILVSTGCFHFFNWSKHANKNERRPHATDCDNWCRQRTSYYADQWAAPLSTTYVWSDIAAPVASCIAARPDLGPNLLQDNPRPPFFTLPTICD